MSQTQKLVLDFALSEDRRGTVDVSISVNEEPQQVGMHLLQLFPPGNMPYYAGYPILVAKVRSTGNIQGYANCYAWIQVIKQDENLQFQPWEMDLAPWVKDESVPFCASGWDPSLFDAPARTHRVPINWTARSFLVYSDDCLMTKNLRPLVAFEWGFSIAEREGQVVIKKLTKLDLDVWAQHTDLLSESYPRWNFIVNSDNVENREGDE